MRHRKSVLWLHIASVPVVHFTAFQHVDVRPKDSRVAATTATRIACPDRRKKRALLLGALRLDVDPLEHPRAGFRKCESFPIDRHQATISGTVIPRNSPIH